MPPRKKVASVFVEDDSDEELAFERERAEEKKKEYEAQKAKAGKRNLDIFMEEMKSSSSTTNDKEVGMVKQLRMDQITVHVPTPLHNQISIKEEDEDIEWERSTNIHIANIPLGISETDLCMEFGIYGPIASVKIMWPRGIDSSITSLSGFVCFMRREDAAKAIAGLDGKILKNLELRVGWGKPIAKLPIHPYFVHPELAKKAAIAAAASVSTLHNNMNIPGVSSISALSNPAINAISATLANGPTLNVQIPKNNLSELRLINRLVERVLVHGAAFEAAILAREKTNPSFDFLTNPNSPSHLYYRWRIYSLLQGDSLKSWSTKPFRFFIDGPIIIPPVYEGDDDEDDDEDENNNDSKVKPLNEDDEAFLFPDERDPDGPACFNAKGQKVLSLENLYSLEQHLRDLTIERERIGEAMFFCMRHCYAIDQILGIIKISILGSNVGNGNFIKIMARVYLLSDLLHNSGAPIMNAWKYRNGIEEFLPKVFDRLWQEIEKENDLSSQSNDVEQENVSEMYKNSVNRLLDAWTQWAIFTPNFLDSLSSKQNQNQQLKSNEGDDVTVDHLIDDDDDDDGKGIDDKKNSIVVVGYRNIEDVTNDEDEIVDEDIDGIPLEQKYDEDIDGIPLEQKYEDIDGIPLKEKYDEDIDGIPLEQRYDEDIDGIPLKEKYDEDIDGIPLEHV